MLENYDKICLLLVLKISKVKLGGVKKMIEIPIVLPEEIHIPTLYKYLKRCPEVFKNIIGFRRPHNNSEVRKKGYNLYVQIDNLDF